MSDAVRRREPLLEAGLLALVGAGVLFDARGYPQSLVEGVPGPAFFPRLLALLLIGCAAILAVRALGRPDRAGSPGGGSPGGGTIRLAGAALWIAGFLLALPLLGNLLALPPLVGGLMWFSGERSPRILIAVSLAFAGFAHLLFVVALGVPLP